MGILQGGCAQSHSVSGVRLCPALSVEGESGTITYGGLASRDRFGPDACVELFLGGERIAHTYSDGTGQFALRFVIRGDASAPLELRVTEEHGRGAVTSETFVLPRPSEARIRYPEDTVPVLARSGGRMDFHGRLDPQPDATPIRDVWMINWTRGLASEVEPTPALGAMFTASVAGLPGHCVAVVSQHDDLGAGGCWWPPGGGGCAYAGCTVDMFLSGECRSEMGVPCTGRGCTFIEVDERRSDVPPPEEGDTIAVPPLSSIDGGVDAPIPDAPVPDVPPDVPPPDAEVM